MTYGKLRTALDAMLDAVQANLDLLQNLRPEAVIGITKPWPPVSPDWRCFCGVPDDVPLRTDRTQPPTMDWRCQSGVEVTVSDLVGYLRAVSAHGGMVRAILADANPDQLLP